MHTIYHTRAVIIKSQSSREADKLFWLFTEDFGLVIAVATGVRKGDAKLKGQLVDYAFVDVDLVQGREVWRLVSATHDKTPLSQHISHPVARAYVRILMTLDRFLVGESAHPELFAEVLACADAVALRDVDASVFETLAIWRILVHLGYIAVLEHEQVLITSSFSKCISMIDAAQTKKMIVAVNTAIKETHL